MGGEALPGTTGWGGSQTHGGVFFLRPSRGRQRLPLPQTLQDGQSTIT